MHDAVCRCHTSKVVVTTDMTIATGLKYIQMSPVTTSSPEPCYSPVPHQVWKIAE
jgi:hypothetical protein